jgi:nickel-dependent lactate racemase
MAMISVPWAAWYEDSERALAFPDSWTVRVHAMRDAPDGGDEQVARAVSSSVDFRNALQAAPRDRPVAICVDDLSRPTPAWRILLPLLSVLLDSGFDRERVRVLMAVGAHRIMTRADLVRKLGNVAVRHLDVRNHSAFSNLVEVGSNGNSAQISRTFVEAGLKIGIGCLMPHSEAGFSGGAKIVLPGLAGIDSIERWHSLCSPLADPEANLSGVVRDNPMRLWMEQVARKAGLDVVANAVMTSSRGIAGLFVGDPVTVHREASELARQVYATPLPDEVDVAVFNAYPKDTELDQVVNALHIINSSRRMITHDRGTIVLTSAASEGRGFHYLFGQGMRLPAVFNPAKVLEGRRLLVFSPRANTADIAQLIPSGAEFYQRWDQVITRLKALYGESCRVAVFPCGSLQIAVRAVGRPDEVESGR